MIYTRRPKFLLLGVLAIALVSYALIRLVYAPVPFNPASTDRLDELRPFLQQELTGCQDLTCWDGIIPGITTRGEARSLLEALYGSENLTVTQSSLYWEQDSLSTRTRGGGLSISDQDIVDEIHINLLERTLSVAELVDQIGEPSFVYVNRAFPSETYCAGALILYPSKGVIAWLYPVGDFTGINPTQSIESLDLLSPELANNWSITDSVKLDWQGYLDYCNFLIPSS
jgi:hypothetical protein